MYTRQVDRQSGVASPWRRQAPPAFVCLGPDAPGLDPTVAVVATVRRDFRQFPIERAAVLTRPVGQSLVNAVTQVLTTVDGRDVIRKDILGLPVVVTAVARSYTWRFGDGTSLSVVAQGAPAAVSHTYGSAGQVAVSLDVTYGGTFTVGGSPTVYDVQGTATIQGPATSLTLREARTQLEAGSGG